MTDETENENDEPDELEANEPEYVTKDSLIETVREIVQELVTGIPETTKPTNEPEGPITLRDIEKASREAVEAAMEPLRAALESKPKPKPKKKAEPVAHVEPTPATNEKKNKLQSFLWGEQ